MADTSSTAPASNDIESATTPHVKRASRAAELIGRGWLNTGGAELSLESLRGKIVVLDFWTFCCINCLHVLDELRPLEEKYGDALVVVGVHSPKFDHERDPEALAAAVERYGVEHPVLDDPDLRTWDAYAARAWPTLVVIDPEGYVVSSMAGEGHAEALDRIIAQLVEQHERAGTLRREGNPYIAPAAAETTLRFPGKALALPGGGFLVSDSARHRLVELACDRETVVRVIGGGERGRADGPAEVAAFSEPQGMCLLPDEVARQVGYDLVVADTVNHLLRGINLAQGSVVTVAGTGDQWRADNAASGALNVDLSSPWDVAWYDWRVIIAMAGIHQLWWFDPREGTAGVYAGTTVESLRDGELDQVWMAQPSGLAVDGDRLWIADSETSALRFIEAGQMRTAVGQGLFDFGHVDGPAAEALLQHPLGVAVLASGKIAVADTYNRALRCFDPTTNEVSTLAEGLAEPSDIVEVDDQLVVVESASHRLSAVETSESTVSGQRHRLTRKATSVAPGLLRLEVLFTPAPGQKLDDSFGPPVKVTVTSDPPHLLAAGAGDSTQLGREIRLAPGVDSGVLQVVAQAATCDAEAEFPACHLTRQDWGVPIEVHDGAASVLELTLRG
ncbi:NHL domain-containing thioredoxin family protein [Natronoglycomyces albus]|uniref:NHL domain-containing thioredoxin family protein n=1 Tax=Natronoglycomyces albus TaxID=2811108 RepID=A0A895XHZ1_9ACTN|nr:NHL domain-containing thioredoxin family protein [Natronoglycomyces albus]QSB05441.1 NHL domain-containing thioredoxin family protein [Natronoglycomyces albus]